MSDTGGSGGSWRTISVAVRAEMAPYLMSMKQGATATREFGRAGSLAQVEIDKLAASSKKLDQFGSKMTRNVTLPVALAGAASVKLAADYNTAFTKMQSLAGVTADEVGGLKKAVDELAGKTAQSPAELADALYTIRSAGVDGAAALEVLEISAKSSAIGLGETADIANAMTSILATYGKEGMTAAQAGDLLAASVAEGKFEASEFAGQLGQLLPMAVELGIGLEEVGGSMAFLSIGTGDTAKSATQLAGIMQKLVKPTEQARKELESVGLSTAQLRKVVSEQGLVAALQLLNDKFDGNSERMGRVFEDVEGLNGVLDILKDNGVGTAESIARISEQAGMLDDRFQGLSETDEFAFQQAIVDLQRLAIQVGQDLIPFLADVAGGVSAVVEVFDMLPGPVKSSLLGLVGIAAVMGPLAKVAGTVGGAMAKLFTAGTAARVAEATTGVEGLGAAGGTSAGSVGRLGTAMAALGWAGAIAGAAAFADSLNKVSIDADRLWALTGEDLADETIKIEALGIASGQDPYAELPLDLLLAMRDALGENYTAESLLGDAIARGEAAVANKAAANEKYGSTTKDNTTAVEDETAAIDDNTSSIEDNVSVAQERFDLERNAADATANTAEAYAALGDAIAASNGDSDEYRAAKQAEADALAGVQEAVAGVEEAERDLAQARIDAAASYEDLQRTARGNALSEQEAVLDLADAVQNEADVLADPDKTDEEKQRATIARQRAELALENARDQIVDTNAELAKGIEGSDGVVAAKERVTQAAEAQRDAEVRVGEAAAASAQVLEDAKAQEADARKALEDAIIDEAEAQWDLALATDGAEVAQQKYLESLVRWAAQMDPNSPFRQNLLSFIDDLNGMPSAWDGNAVDSFFPPVGNGWSDATDGFFPDVGNGIAGDRWGSIHAYAKGGITRAHVTRRQLFKYGEPETGGEALIPRLGDRARSEAILATAAGWYGGMFVPAGTALPQLRPSAPQGGSGASAAAVADLTRAVAAMGRPNVNVTGVNLDNPERTANHIDRKMLFR